MGAPRTFRRIRGPLGKEGIDAISTAVLYEVVPAMEYALAALGTEKRRVVRG